MCCCGPLCFLFCKRKTAYELRISDWSSDVCSSDLRTFGRLRCGKRRILRFAARRERAEHCERQQDRSVAHQSSSTIVVITASTICPITAPASSAYRKSVV